jgi:NADH dehydrogenase
MILVTGGTGFIGNVLIRHLSKLERPVKLLIRPSKQSPRIPRGLPVDVAVTSLMDEKGLRAAMKDVDIIYHLAGAETLGRQADLSKVDIKGTQAVLQAAARANISRFVYISHLGADRASAYPLLKAKAIAEHHIKSSGIPYTIFRSGLVYGEDDHFTNGLAFLLKVSPGVVMLPDGGTTLLQPIWVEDLVTAMVWALDLPLTRNRVIELGGPEYLSFREICEIVLRAIHIKRHFVKVSPVFLNIFTELIEIIMPNFPVSVFWLDYLATNRTTNLDVLPRLFNLLPARMSQRIGYLEGKKFRQNWWRIVFRRKRTIPKWE